MNKIQKIIPILFFSFIINLLIYFIFIYRFFHLSQQRIILVIQRSIGSIKPYSNFLLYLIIPHFITDILWIICYYLPIFTIIFLQNNLSSYFSSITQPKIIVLKIISLLSKIYPINILTQFSLLNIFTRFCSQFLDFFIHNFFFILLAHNFFFYFFLFVVYIIFMFSFMIF